MTSSGAPGVRIGRVAGVFGLRGDLRVIASDPDDFRPGLHLQACRPDGRASSFDVASVKPCRSGLLVHLHGCDDRASATLFQGCTLFAERASLPPPPAGHHRDSDLVGFDVRDLRLGFLGKVVDVAHYPAADMVIVGERGVLVPLLAAYSVEIDIAGRRITTRLPVGFEDI